MWGACGVCSATPWLASLRCWAVRHEAFPGLVWVRWIGRVRGLVGFSRPVFSFLFLNAGEGRESCGWRGVSGIGRGLLSRVRGSLGMLEVDGDDQDFRDGLGFGVGGMGATWAGL